MDVSAAPWHKSVGQSENRLGNAQHHQHGVDTWMAPKSQDLGSWKNWKKVIYHSFSGILLFNLFWGIAMQDTKSQKWEVVMHPISGITTPLQATVPTVPTVPTVTFGQVADRIGICEKPGLRLRRTRHRPFRPTENRGALGAGPFVKRLQLGVQRFILPLLIPLPMNSQEILPSLYVHGGMTMTRQSPDTCWICLSCNVQTTSLRSWSPLAS